MATVTYGRTISRNYQSKRAEIQLDVPEDWNIADVLQLAKFMVDYSLGEKVSRRDANRLYREYFGDPDADIEEMELQ